MTFSMHSHSGQFCPSHTQNMLEEMIQRAIALRMTHFALTEHMPRTDISNLYPEEVEQVVSITEFVPLYSAYLQEAVRLRANDYGATIKLLTCNPLVDFFINKAVQLSGGTEDGLFAHYYDLHAKPLKDPKKLVHIWRNILKILEFIVGYGDLIEVNSSGLRKGLGERILGGISAKK
ncbi:uncharacterized protein PAC_16628 [Phialocephala subalpina]|uniref:Histidinol-phosphatase n=1 Tax=Phialocephala subalpina TaxID=576137 RepID=A0A1L7XP34_9HELO|nr:uncharacterized protein PAC_16628 [Phialocephala subalpina]